MARILNHAAERDDGSLHGQGSARGITSRSWEESGEVYAAESSTAAVGKRVSAAGYRPAQDRTGRNVVFSDQQSPFIAGGKILLGNIEGKGQTTPFSARVSTSGVAIEAANHPRFSPDGAWISYTYWPDYAVNYPSDDGQRAIWRMRTNGTQRQRVLDWPGDQQWASYSPDGAKIVFLSTHRPDGTEIPYSLGPAYAHEYLGQLFVANADGTNPVQISPPRGSFQELTAIGNPSFSPDGTKVVFHAKPTACCSSELPHVYTVNTDGSGLRQIDGTPLRFTTPKGTDWCVTGGGQNASFSPDGTKLIYESPNYCKSIIRSYLDGSGRRVVHSHDRDGGPLITYPQYRPAAPSETLAHRFRPLMWFDEGEHWNPLDVGNFFAEGQHRICDSASACVTATSVRDLRTHTSSNAWIDIAGSGSDATAFRSPEPHLHHGRDPGLRHRLAYRCVLASQRAVSARLQIPGLLVLLPL